MKVFEVWAENTPLAASVSMADTFFTRFRGLMLRASPAPGEGLFLENCSAIHCMFMRFPIDVIYLDRNYTVVGRETVKPWRIGHFFPGAKHVLELEAGRSALPEIGTTIELKERNPL